jgi:hypothetical protein
VDADGSLEVFSRNRGSNLAIRILSKEFDEFRSQLVWHELRMESGAGNWRRFRCLAIAMACDGENGIR